MHGNFSESQIIGLVSGSLAAEDHMAVLRHNRVRLGVVTIPALIRSPRLLMSMYARQSAGSADAEDSGYVVTTGAREEFGLGIPINVPPVGLLSYTGNGWLSCGCWALLELGWKLTG